MRKKPIKQRGYIYLIKEKIEWLIKAGGPAFRSLLRYFFIIVFMTCFAIAFTAFFFGQWIKGMFFLALMIIVVWIFFWKQIIEASEMIETFIWGMPIKDPDWKTQRWKRRFVWKRKKT